MGVPKRLLIEMIFLKDLFFISGAFSVFDSQVKRIEIGLSRTSLVGFDLLPHSATRGLPFLDMPLTGNLQLGWASRESRPLGRGVYIRPAIS